MEKILEEINSMLTSCLQKENNEHEIQKALAYVKGMLDYIRSTNE